MSQISPVLKLGRNITVFPVIHGSGDFAVEVRRLMLSRKFDCLAVPLPPSFQQQVEAAVEQLPAVSVVLQRQPAAHFLTAGEEFTAEGDSDEGSAQDHELPAASYVPIDPCQPVIAALRIAMQERIPRALIVG
jgi:hypothetical protein